MVHMDDKGGDFGPCRSSGISIGQADEAHPPGAGCNTSLSSWKYAWTRLGMLFNQALWLVPQFQGSLLPRQALHIHPS